jgi:N-acetylglutamate synthase-like GNAT family acetyltransferase
MTAYTLRTASADDFSTIKDLIRNARINPLGLKWPRFIVAQNDRGVVIGCAQIKQHQDNSHELASLVVSPAYQGQGIARSLIEHLIQRHQGDLYLTCGSSLGGFYGKFGFASIDQSQMPPYFRRISRLVSWLDYLHSSDQTMLVMRRRHHTSSK